MTGSSDNQVARVFADIEAASRSAQEPRRPIYPTEESRPPAQAMPPLLSLRAFEASVRLKSLTRAAEELGVTPSAITQHVRAVEAWAGTPLFRRTGRLVVPSEVARAATTSLGEGFDRLFEGAQLLRAPDRKERVISISTPPAFASKWLLPRLEAFRTLHENIEVWVSADMRLVDFSTGDVDLAIRYGAGEYEGLVAEQIMSEAVIPVASPDFIASHAPIERPEDLLAASLLHDMSPDPSCPSWRAWFRARGVDDLRTLEGPRYGDAGLVIEEAIAGNGIGLAKRVIAERDIQAGRLIPLLNDTTPVRFAYWLVWPRGRTLLPPVRAFIAWIRAETAEAGAPAGLGDDPRA
jgi:LysR family transcriptional regulator, glycine cleavage system transcriptional activator